MKKILLVALVMLLSVSFSFGRSVVPSDTGIMLAMKDELKRNMEKISIEKLQKPCYISYSIADTRIVFIRARYGSLVQVMDEPMRTQDVRVVVGNYNLNNEHYLDFNTLWSSTSYETAPIENNYNALRISLWADTDKKFKRAAESYESKVSAIQQQKLNEALPADFSTITPVKLALPRAADSFQRKEWEKTIKDISALFTSYSAIQDAEAQLHFYTAMMYFTDAEGSVVSYPFTIVALQVWAKMQAEDGEPLFDHCVYYVPSLNDLPPIKTIKEEVAAMARRLTELAKAPVFNEAYSGPVLFEGQAAAELIAQKFFADENGLCTRRKPVIASEDVLGYIQYQLENPLEARLDKKVISRSLSLTASPLLKTYEGTPLLGSLPVDMEGSVPPETLPLIENGVLKNMLNGRSPTQRVTGSNGHMHLAMEYNFSKSDIGPSVVMFDGTDKTDMPTLKRKLIDAGKEEGLDYVYIIRKLENASMLMSDQEAKSKKSASRILAIYRVRVADGSEQLMRTAELEGMSLKAFKRVIAVSDKKFAYNTMLQKTTRQYYGKETLNGIPSSFIVPTGILFEEIDLQQEKRSITPKLPVVPNPISSNK